MAPHFQEQRLMELRSAEDVVDLWSSLHWRTCQRTILMRVYLMHCLTT